MSTGPSDEHVLEVLAGATTGATVHVPLVALLEHKARAVEDLRIQVAAIVHDEDDAPTRLHHRPARCEHAHDPVAVRRERRPRRPSRSRTDLALAEVVETEQLVRIAMLLVIVDQPRIRRRRD